MLGGDRDLPFLRWWLWEEEEGAEGDAGGAFLVGGGGGLRLFSPLPSADDEFGNKDRLSRTSVIPRVY